MRAVMGGKGRYWAGVLAAGAICGTAPDRPLPPATAQSREVLLATTTSTRDAGLLDTLLPIFERQTGYRVKVIAVGSGDRKSTRLNSSHGYISYAVFCLKKKKK